MVENTAGVGRRILGGIIDIIVLIIFMVVYGMFFGTTQGGSVNVSGLPALIMFLLMIAYFVVLEKTTGKTAGKYITKMKVVNEDGNNISWGRSLGRNLARIIDWFPFFYIVGIITALATEKTQRVGDLISTTYVVTE